MKVRAYCAVPCAVAPNPKIVDGGVKSLNIVYGTVSCDK